MARKQDPPSGGIDPDAARNAFSTAIGDWLGANLDPSPDSEVVTGLLGAVKSRAGDVAMGIAGGLVRGMSRRMACNRAGISQEKLIGWCKADKELATLLVHCEQLGTGVFEHELFRRALAGDEDKGSMRALEMVAKARMPEYRDKVQQQIDVVHHATQAMDSAIDGWQGQP